MNYIYINARIYIGGKLDNILIQFQISKQGIILNRIGYIPATEAQFSK